MKELKRMITKKVNVQGRFYMQHDHEISLLEQWNWGNAWNYMDI